MKNIIYLIAFLFCSMGQAQQLETNNAFQSKDSLKLAYQSKKNLAKLSLSSLLVGNIHLQYERILNRKISVAIAYSTIPESSIPFQVTVQNYIDDEATYEKLNELQISYSSVTPEIRFYLSKKGYGKGFYLAPFYRNTTFSLNGVSFSYENEQGAMSNIKTSGSFKSNSFGLLIGTQFNLGKSVVLDWWIIGPHFGSISGSLNGRSMQLFSDLEQMTLRSELSELDFPIVEEEILVTNQEVKLDIDSPWGNIRAGLTIGYRF